MEYNTMYGYIPILVLLLLATQTGTVAAPKSKTARQQARPGSPPAPAALKKDTADTLPVPQHLTTSGWKGKRFILLEKGRMFRGFGYHLYTSPHFEQSRAPVDSLVELPNHRLRYERFEKAQVVVTSVQPLPGKEFLVTFSVDSAAPWAYAKTTSGIIEGIARIDDLEGAAGRWRGRTIYSRRRSIDIYDEVNSRFTSIKVSITEPLTVREVRWGIAPLPPKPIWLVVRRVSGETGIIPVYYSWTNVLPSNRTSGPPWQSDILEENPREKYHWDEVIWEAIDTHRLLTGMTAEQVRLSWGDPDSKVGRIEAGSSRIVWPYERGTLVFAKDSLVRIE
jgi:hypothetical protein